MFDWVLNTPLSCTVAYLLKKTPPVIAQKALTVSLICFAIFAGRQKYESQKKYDSPSYVVLRYALHHKDSELDFHCLCLEILISVIPKLKHF